MTLNVALMICWIVMLANLNLYAALTIGTVVFALILVGLTFYLVLTIKEVRLNRRQANFVDSVTHELKSPIAALKLYVETLQMRDVDAQQRSEFYRIMETELRRLDGLINQLLEVGRLDAIGQESQPEDVSLEPLLRHCAANACAHHQCEEREVFSFDIEPAVIKSRRMILEMIFGNLLDNAIKYGGSEPKVDVQVRVSGRRQITTRIRDNGAGVPRELRKKIFGLFFRGGDELHRTKKGTGLGLYIVRTLVLILKGSVSVHDQTGQSGSVFEVQLPGRPQT